MKITKILSLIALMAVAISCSKDDEPAPQIENASLSFSQDQEILVVPDRLLESTDPNAMLAVSMIQMANDMSSSIALFEPPAGATRSTELITPANGRTSAEKGVVYIWTDAQNGSVAYQVKDAGDKYIFELFFKATVDSPWYRYLYAQELKDKSAGHMVMYDVWGFFDDTQKAEMFRWSWTRKGDVFTFKMSDNLDAFNFTATVNTKTKAGSLEYFQDGLKHFEISWDAQGKGTWKEFDETGAVVEEGTWE